MGEYMGKGGGVLAGALAALFDAAAKRESAELLLQALEALPEPAAKAPEVAQGGEAEEAVRLEGQSEIARPAAANKATSSAAAPAPATTAVLTTPEPCKATPMSLASATPADVAKVARPLRDRLAQRLTGKQPLMAELGSKSSELVAEEVLPSKKSHNFLGGMPFRWRMLLLQNSKALQAKNSKKGRRKVASKTKATTKPSLRASMAARIGAAAAAAKRRGGMR